MKGKAKEPFPLDRDLILSVERVLVQHRGLMRRARARAQNALYFLGLARPTLDAEVNKAVTTYREFSTAKISEHALLLVDHGNDLERLLFRMAELLDPQWNTRAENWLQNDEQFDPWLESVDRQAQEGGVSTNKNWMAARTGLLELWRCHQEIKCWQQAVDGFSPLVDADSDDDWGMARGTVRDFLAFEGNSWLHQVLRRWKQKGNWTQFAAQVLGNLPRWIGKHLALLLAIALGLFVLFKVEAVNSLIRNMGLWAIVPFGLALLPLLIHRILLWRGYRHREEIPAWDVGGSTHRSLRRLARAPDRLLDRWPTSVSDAGSGRFNLQETWASTQGAVADLGRQIRHSKSLLTVIVKGQVVRVGLYLLSWIVGVLVLWGLVMAGLVDSSYLTVYLIVVILYILVLLGRLIDFWDFLEAKPIRWHLLGYAAIAFWALYRGYGLSLFIAAFALWALWFFWTYRQRPGRPLRLVLGFVCMLAAIGLGLIMLNRTEASWVQPATSSPAWRQGVTWPFDENSTDPIVVMAASGGGSRAAVYAAKTLNRLEDTDSRCPGGAEGCSIGDYLEAISSVSGGSLANAGFVARRFAASSGTNIESELEQAVSGDFLLSTLTGAIHPLKSRGDAIEQSWQGLDELVRSCQSGERSRWTSGASPNWGETGVALGDVCLSDLAAHWRNAARSGDALPPFPVPLFNTTTLDGHDLVISPLSLDYYTSAGVRDESRSLSENKYQDPDSTWVYYRDTSYGLEDLLGEGYDPLLSSAVRASANFPFGFPLVELRTSRALFLRPNWRKDCPDPGPNFDQCSEVRVHLTDGGALSNSGMWPLFRLLINRAEMLKHRGVLLVVVDASKMAESGDVNRAYASLQGTIGDQAPIGQYLHRTMLDRLETVYGNGLAVVQIDLIPLKDQNIYTTWTLDKGTREDLGKIFVDQWEKVAPDLAARWSYLWERARDSKKEPPEGLELIDRARPPSD